MIDVPPALVLVVGGFVLPLVPLRFRSALLLGLPLVALAFVWLLPDGATASWEVHGYALAPVKVDALGRLFATIFAIMGFAGALFALNQARTLELASAFIYAGSAIGVAQLTRIAQAVDAPVVAIGGITPDNAPAAIQAGAAGVAVIGAVMKAADPRATTSRLLAATGAPG